MGESFFRPQGIDENIIDLDSGAITLTPKDAAKRQAALDAGKDPEVVAATEANIDEDNNAFFKDNPLPLLPPEDGRENAG